MAEYKISSLSACEVSTIMAQHEPRFVLPLWNLFWLSIPEIDNLAAHAKSERWFLHYQAVENGLSCLIREVETDPVLEYKLSMHPTSFLEWFKREDHGIYEFAYAQLGGEKWVETVKRRAAEAAYRMANELPPEMQGSNIFAFVQKPRNDTLRDGTGAL